MNHLKARLRQHDGKYDYTSKNNDYIHPIGYCAGLKPWTDEQKAMFGHARVEQWERKEEPFKHKYHVDGHLTADEACECYKKYQLDHTLRFGATTNSQQRCEVPTCKAWTQAVAYIGGYYIYNLCLKHLRREIIETLYTVGESWES